MIGGFFKALYHWMALLGLAMKDDEPIEKRDPWRRLRSLAVDLARSQ